MNAAVIVPTLNAGHTWVSWIDALLATGMSPDDVYMIDSGSADDTVSQAEKAGFNIKKIAPETFDHGGTRQMAVADLAGYDLAIFLTQDAILSHPDSLKKILAPFTDVNIAAVCGRQLPRRGAGAIESHARLFNYPEISTLNSASDIATKGLKTAFISNSFAAYRISVLKEVGSFPQNVIFGEDMHLAARILKAGYKIAYAAEACVYHSHGYSITQEMKRYFDMGVFHAREPWIRQELGGAEGEGKKFVISELKYLLKNAFWRVPEGVLRTVLRYAGFRLGLSEQKLPPWLKRRLAMNKAYFSD